MGVGDGLVVGVGLGVGGAVGGGGVGDGAGDEAPTLPHPERTRMAATEATTADVLKRWMKASVASILADTRRRTISLGIEEWLILDERERGNVAAAFASFRAHNPSLRKQDCVLLIKKDAAALA